MPCTQNPGTTLTRHNHLPCATLFPPGVSLLSLINSADKVNVMSCSEQQGTPGPVFTAHSKIISTFTTSYRAGKIKTILLLNEEQKQIAKILDFPV